MSHLLRTKRELEMWAHSYALEGVDHRAMVCGAAAQLIDKAVYELLTVKV